MRFLEWPSPLDILIRYFNALTQLCHNCNVDYVRYIGTGSYCVFNIGYGESLLAMSVFIIEWLYGTTQQKLNAVKLSCGKLTSITATKLSVTSVHKSNIVFLTSIVADEIKIKTLRLTNKYRCCCCCCCCCRKTKTKVNTSHQSQQIT